MSNYHVVKLMTNHLYPTYQLHAFMASKKTSPGEGLRIAALTTLQWLRLRLGEHVPPEIADLPEPEDYQKIDHSALKSFYRNSGFVVNVVSIPEKGIWSLQISEPDLGSEPGNPEQTRSAVGGRVIETNVAYKIIGDQLECGFRTVISDPDWIQEKAEVYRLAIIRRLLENPDFGLKQLVKLQHAPIRIQNADQLKSFANLAKSPENQIPCVLFTQLREERKIPKIEDMVPQLGALNPLMKLDAPMPPLSPVAVDPPYDISKFSRSGVTYCRTYILEDSLLDKTGEFFHKPLKPGDILTIEPVSQGGRMEIYPYKTGKAGQEQTVAQLQNKFYTYCRDRQYAFGNIIFLTSARNELIRSTEDATRKAAQLSESFEQEMEEIKTKWRSEVADKDREIENLKDKISRLKEHQSRLEEEKDALREIADNAGNANNQAMQNKDMEIQYLRRKLNQPNFHEQVADWTAHYFADRLELHPKAVKLLEDRSAQNTDVSLICDALDYLATDYWDCRYQVIDKDTMRSRCSQKYGRPFEITPVGDMTIEQLPGEYKIKCVLGNSGKRIEHGLDYHLKVGNDPENLLRIYFLHDDEKKKIIVGSLPCHLTAAKIK